MPQRTFLMMLIVICVTILCFVWMVRDSTKVVKFRYRVGGPDWRKSLFS
ncbi:Hok/Gef family protein [Escherichia coli]|nr:Hok/Gef family protein [Escherichia coli]